MTDALGNSNRRSAVTRRFGGLFCPAASVAAFVHLCRDPSTGVGLGMPRHALQIAQAAESDIVGGRSGEVSLG